MSLLNRLVRIGVAEGEQSLTAIKSIVMLSRLCLKIGRASCRERVY